MRPASEPAPSPGLRPWIVAVTGGIGSGKSTVARLLGKLGARVVEADELAHAVTARPAVIAQIVTLLGPAVRGPDGTLDRAEVARRVFADATLRGSLEAIVHPEVRLEIDKVLAKWQASGFDTASPLPGNRPFLVLDIPLLERSPYRKLASAVLFVEAPPADRLRRVRASRGWDEAELAARERNQAPLDEKRAGADAMIANPEGTSQEVLQQQLSHLLAQWCARPDLDAGVPR